MNLLLINSFSFDRLSQLYGLCWDYEFRRTLNFSEDKLAVNAQPADDTQVFKL